MATSSRLRRRNASRVIPLESVPTDVVTLEQVIDAIRQEAGCTAIEAEVTIAWLNRYIVATRNESYLTQYPTDAEMAGTEYRIFNTVVPHDKVARPGSAHDLLERHLLKPELDETGLVHSDRDERHSPTYCQVAVCLGVLQT